MKIQLGQSTREIEATKVTKFKVVQDNRSKQITVVEYEMRDGSTREMAFLNDVEAVLNPAGRYIQAQSKREYCAKILPEPVVEEIEA
jgi:hypothetical protein